MNFKPLTEILNIKYPIIQGGMAWISEANLAAAVSNAGGLGVIAAGNAERTVIEKEIKLIQSLTDKPYALNIMLLSPYAEDMIQMAIDYRIPIVITGAGNPGKYMESLKSAGIKVIPVVASVALAKRMENLGADAVIAEGMEAGGHIGELTSMTLIPQVVDAVQIPVIAAGGIGDGRGVAAAMMLGAQGIQVGTRFLVAHECTVHPQYKASILKAKDTSTAVTGRQTGHPVRLIKNKLYRKYQQMEKDNPDPEVLEQLGAGSLRKSAVEGNMTEGSIMAGQIAGLIRQEESAQAIVESLFFESQKIIQRMKEAL